jgi:predicted RNA-binding protein Jag
MSHSPEVLTEARQAELTSEVLNWHKPGAEPLHFPPALTSDERKFVHALCESRGDVMSSKSEGKGYERHVVIYDAPVAAGVVRGVTDVCRGALQKRVEEWKEGTDAELHFEPSLTTAEREYVHSLAKERGLKSKSEGVTHHGDDWHIVVRR